MAEPLLRVSDLRTTYTAFGGERVVRAVDGVSFTINRGESLGLSGGPELIIADEPTNNLDVTIQAQYLDMLKDLQRRTGVALLFITHNLGIVAKMCDRVAVMYAGRIVEQGTTREIFKTPRHPYSQALLSSIPKIGSREPLYAIPGQPPDLASLPGGCAFSPRCTYTF